jgi:hypothetical protein
MPEVASWALAHGADVHARSGSGFTPIDMLGRWPTRGPHDRLEEMSDLLLRHGAERSAFWAVAMNQGDWLRARHAEGRIGNPVSDVGGLVTFATPRSSRDADAAARSRVRSTSPAADPPANARMLPQRQRLALADILLQRGATLPGVGGRLGKADWSVRSTRRTLAHPPHGDSLLTAAVDMGASTCCSCSSTSDRRRTLSASSGETMS